MAAQGISDFRCFPMPLFARCSCSSVLRTWIKCLRRGKKSTLGPYLRANQDVEFTPAFGASNLWTYGVTLTLPGNLSGLHGTMSVTGVYPSIFSCGRERAPTPEHYDLGFRCCYLKVRKSLGCPFRKECGDCGSSGHESVCWSRQNTAS